MKPLASDKSARLARMGYTFRILREAPFWMLLLTILALLLLTPLVTSQYFVILLTEALIFAVMVTGLNFLLGHLGLVSLGQAAFLGCGAYFTAVATLFWGWPVWLAMLTAVSATCLIALLVGSISVRTQSVQFLLITLAFGEMFHAAAGKIRVTGGDDGMNGIPRLDLSSLGLNADDATTFFYVVLAFFILTMITLKAITVSGYGRVVGGIRENEKRMRGLGYETWGYKVVAFAIAGLFAGLAGSLLVQNNHYINPQVMTWQISGEALLMAIIGGSRSFFGPFLGALFFVLAKAWLATVTDAYLMVLGLLFALVVAFFEGGISGFINRRILSLRRTPPAAGENV